MGISVEIRDCIYGNPAEGVPVNLLQEVDSRWDYRASGCTDRFGLVTLLAQEPARGRYRLVVDPAPYYLLLGTEPAVSPAEMTFRVFHTGERVRFQVMITPTSYFAVRCNDASG